MSPTEAEHAAFDREQLRAMGDINCSHEVPDYQYEMLEDALGAGWKAAFPEWVNPTEETTPEEFNRGVNAWLVVMEEAYAELRKRGWVIARRRDT